MKTSALTKVFMIAFLVVGISSTTFAQKAKKEKSKDKKEAKELVRPEKVGHAATDDYVTSAFNLYEKNQKVSAQLADAANNVQDAGAIKSDLDAQMEEVKGLLGKSSDVISQAKTITPKTDSMKAVNTATKALNETQKNIPGQLEAIKNQGATE